MGTQRSGAKKLYKAKKNWVAFGLATGAVGLLAVAPTAVSASDTTATPVMTRVTSTAASTTTDTSISTTDTDTPATATTAPSTPIDPTATDQADEMQQATTPAPMTTEATTAATISTAADPAPAAEDSQPVISITPGVSGPKGNTTTATAMTSITFDFTPDTALAQVLKEAGYNSNASLHIVRYNSIDGSIAADESDHVTIGAVQLPYKQGYDVIWYYNQDLRSGKSEDQVYHYSQDIPAHRISLDPTDPSALGITVHYFKSTRQVPVRLVDTDGHFIKRAFVTAKNYMPPLSWVRDQYNNHGITPFAYQTEIEAPIIDGYAAVKSYQKLSTTTEYLITNNLDASYPVNTTTEQGAAMLSWGTHTPTFVYQAQHVTGIHTYTDEDGKTILPSTAEPEALPVAPGINGYELDPFKSTIQILAGGKEFYPAKATDKPAYLGALFPAIQDWLVAPNSPVVTLLMTMPSYVLQHERIAELEPTTDSRLLNQLKAAATRFHWNRTAGNFYNLGLLYYKALGLTADMGVGEAHAAEVEVITHYVYKAVPHQVAEPTGVMTKTVTYTVNFTGIDHAPMTITKTFTKTREATPLTLWTPDVTLPTVAGTQHLNFLPAADIWTDLNQTAFSSTIDYRPSEQTLVVSFEDNAGNQLATDQVINGVTGQTVTLPAPLIDGYTQNHGPLAVTLTAADHTIQHVTVTYTKDLPKTRTQVPGAVSVAQADFYDLTKSQLDDGPRVRTQVPGAVSVSPADFYDFTKSQLDDGPRVRTQVPGAVSVAHADFYDLTKSQLDDGPRVRTQVPGAVSVSPADFYDLTKSQLDDGPRVRTQVPGAVSVSPADFYDHRKPTTVPLTQPGAATPTTQPLAQPATAQPAAGLTAGQPAKTAAVLPQTGDAQERGLVALGAMALCSLFALGITTTRRKRL
ncbi:MucBP domain-containing protein [Lacticaseibacillus suihuaensis]